VADIDGFNLPRTVAPECLTDFVDLVVPVLQERGLFKRAYAQGTLRDKLFGHPKLSPTHPGSRFKFGTDASPAVPARTSVGPSIA
jgi:hypothetical protein